MVARLPIDDDNDDDNDEAWWTLIEALRCFTHSLVELVSLFVMIGAKRKILLPCDRGIQRVGGSKQKVLQGA